MKQPAPTSDSFEQIKSIFQRALERPPPARRAFVDQTCSDLQVRRQVLDLLQHHDADAEFLHPFVGESDSQTQSLSDSLIGYDLGGFVLKRLLGSGGMGSVYEAQQTSPQRHAAVKILRLDIADDAVQRRVAREAAILARLQHPGIAQVYSAGTLLVENRKFPWLAMELVAGEPLSRWIQQRPLNRRERLQLLVRLCDAVEHAHQRNVIHRDLKPDNILVQTRQQEGTEGELPWQPKVLDFGVAKLRDENDVSPQVTQSGQLIGTMAYMSPEQLAGDPNLVDARSDVYALGIIGFEMLTGRLPHDRRQQSVTQVLRGIGDETPRRLRSIDPSYRGDPDIIFAQAMAPDVDQRYQSVSDLADDIRAFLEHRPIQARPPTLRYRLGKSLRRNRVPAGGITTTLLALILGLLAYRQQAQHSQRLAQQATAAAADAEYEAAKAKAINEFITNDFLLRLMESLRSNPRQPTELLENHAHQAIANISTMFQDRPKLEAAVRNEMGTVFYNLRASDQAAEQFAIALRLWEAELGPAAEDTLKAVNNLGQARMLPRRLDDAERLYQRALQGRLNLLGEEHPATLASMNNYADLMRQTDRLDEAEVWMRRALDGQKELLGQTHTDTLISMVNLGALLIQQGRAEDALALHREAHQISNQTLGDNHSLTLYTATRLANTLLRHRQLAEARHLMIQVLPQFESMFGEHHAETLLPRRILAEAHAALGEPELARQQLTRVLSIANSMTPPPQRLIDKVTRQLQQLESTASPQD